MSKEILEEPITRLELSSIGIGDRVLITTGEGEEAFEYEFEAEDTSTIWPNGKLKETKPDGQVIGPLPFSLHGSGIWTDRRQNPVQDQATAFTSYFDSLSVGSFVVGSVPNEENRLVFDKPGQEIRKIQLIKA